MDGRRAVHGWVGPHQNSSKSPFRSIREANFMADLLAKHKVFGLQAVEVHHTGHGWSHGFHIVHFLRGYLWMWIP